MAMGDLEKSCKITRHEKKVKTLIYVKTNGVKKHTGRQRCIHPTEGPTKGPMDGPMDGPTD